MACRHPCAPGQVTDSAASHPTTPRFPIRRPPAGLLLPASSLPPAPALSPSARVAVGGTQLRAAILPPAASSAVYARPRGPSEVDPTAAAKAGAALETAERTGRRPAPSERVFFPAADREARSRGRCRCGTNATDSSRVQGAEASKRRRARCGDGSRRARLR
jgi:hypothetical protein